MEGMSMLSWREPVRAFRRRVLPYRVTGTLLLALVPSLLLILLVDAFWVPVVRIDIRDWVLTDWIGMGLASCIVVATGVLFLAKANRFTHASVARDRIAFGFRGRRSRIFDPGPSEWPRLPYVDTADIVACELHVWSAPPLSRRRFRMWTLLLETGSQGKVVVTPFFDPFRAPSILEPFESLVEALREAGVPAVRREHSEEWTVRSIPK